MAISWKTLLDTLPRIAMGFLPGIAGAGNSVVRAAARTLPSQLRGAAFEYPALPGDFWYMQDAPKGGHATTVDSKTAWVPALNGSLDRNALDAGLAQSLQEHNRAVKGGYEKTLEEWWPNEDVRPRKEFHPTSSAVKSVKIDKDGNIQIQWHSGDGKWYTYRGGSDLRDTSRIAMELLSAPSIGRALVRKGRLAHADSKDLTASPVPDSNIGFWGRKHFDPRMVGGMSGNMIG